MLIEAEQGASNPWHYTTTSTVYASICYDFSPCQSFLSPHASSGLSFKSSARTSQSTLCILLYCACGHGRPITNIYVALLRPLLAVTESEIDTFDNDNNNWSGFIFTSAHLIELCSRGTFGAKKRLSYAYRLLREYI